MPSTPRPTEPTPTQRKVLDYLRVFLHLNHQLPPKQTIASAFGWASANAAHTHLAALEKKGHLRRNELGNLMLAYPPVALQSLGAQQIDDLQRLANDLLNPEELGYACTIEVRDRARIALGRTLVECPHLGASKGQPA